MKLSRVSVNWRPGSAATRSSAFLVSLSSVTNSRPMATAVAGTSKTTAATNRWSRLTSRTLRGRVERVLGELTVAVMWSSSWAYGCCPRLRSDLGPLSA